MKPASIFALILLAALPALAQNNISWVSHSGVDGLNFLCSMTNPCATFQRAYGVTANNGIIKAMDAGEYGTINITKPIIIDGNGVGAAIEVNSSGPGVSVNTAGTVEIRNLGIHVGATCTSGCHGIDSVSNVSIENVSITGAPYIGVSVTGATATIHGLTVTGASGLGIFVTNGNLTVNDSVVRYSNTGILVESSSAVTQALIERSKMISNTTGLYVLSFGPASTARISDCVITGNSLGVLTSGGGQIFTFRNNTWAGNTTDGATPFSVSLK